MTWNVVTDINDGQSFGGAAWQSAIDAVVQIQGSLGSDETANLPALVNRLFAPAIGSINDDAAMTLGIGTGVIRGLLAVIGNTPSAGFALIAFRTGDPSAHATVIASSGVTVDGGVGALGGTTGTDGRLTVHARTDQTWLQLENRTGAVRGYTFSFLAVTGSFTAVAWS